LERYDAAALRVDAAHHVFDRAVLARRVHRLKDQQDAPAILRVQLVLQLAQSFDAALQEFRGFLLGLNAAAVGGVVVAQAETSVGRDAVSAQLHAESLPPDGRRLATDRSGSRFTG